MVLPRFALWHGLAHKRVAAARAVAQYARQWAGARRTKHAGQAQANGARAACSFTRVSLAPAVVLAGLCGGVFLHTYIQNSRLHFARRAAIGGAVCPVPANRARAVANQTIGRHGTGRGGFMPDLNGNIYGYTAQLYLQRSAQYACGNSAARHDCDDRQFPV